MKIIDKNKDYYVFFAKDLPKGVVAWQGELILTCGATAHHIQELEIIIHSPKGYVTKTVFTRDNTTSP